MGAFRISTSSLIKWPTLSGIPRSPEGSVEAKRLSRGLHLARRQPPLDGVIWVVAKARIPGPAKRRLRFCSAFELGDPPSNGSPSPLPPLRCPRPGVGCDSRFGARASCCRRHVP